MSKFTLRIVILLNFLTVSCLVNTTAGAETPTADPMIAPKKIKIGWVGPLTGNSAVLGIDSVKAAESAIDAVNASGGVHGAELELIVEDDQYVTSKTVAGYQKLVAVDGVKLIFTLTYGGVFALADRAKRDEVILVDPLDCNDRIGALNDHVLCVAKTTESLGTLVANHLVEHENTPTGILYFEADPFPKETAEHALARLKELGSDPAVYQGYGADTRDFRSLIERLKAAKVRSLVMFGYDEMGVLARQAKDSGLVVQLYSFATVTSPGFLESARGSAEGTIIVNWLGEGGQKLENFLTAFRKKNGRAPFVHISTLPSYDILNIAANCLRQGAYDAKTEGLDGETLLRCLSTTKDYRGISGIITVDPDGVTRSFHHQMARLRGSDLEPLPDPRP